MSNFSKDYPSPVYAWFVVSLLLLAGAVAFIDRQVVAIVVEPMKRDLGVGDTAIGWLYGVFALFHALAAYPIAWWADRGSRKRIIALGVFFWSLMTVACGLTRTYWILLTARIGVGVGEASLTPATASLVSDLLPREKVPFAMSVYQIGAISGTGIAFVIGGLVLDFVSQTEPLVLPMVGELTAWQQTFVFVGAPGAILALAFLMIREPARRVISGLRQETAADNARGSLAAFYRRNAKMLVLHHAAFLCFALMGYAFVFWTVSYFERVHGEQPAHASQIFGWIFFATAPLGPLMAGLMYRFLDKRGRTDAPITAGMISGLLAIPCILAIQFAPSASFAYLLYAPALICINAPFGIANGALPVIAPPEFRARVAAVYLLVTAFGMMLGPPIAGAFNEYLFTGHDGVRFSIIALVSGFGSLGTFLAWKCRAHYRRSVSDAEAWSED